MRVLHVTSMIDRRDGGPTTALVGLTSAQVRNGLNVSVLATHRAGADLSAADQMRSSGIHVELVGPVRGKLQRIPKLRAAVDEMVSQANVVHIHAIWESIQHHTASVAYQRSVPYVFRPCGMLDPWSLSQNRWKKRLYMAWRLRRDLNYAAAIHYTADAERDLAQTLALSPPAIVVPNGVDLEAFHQLPTRGAFRHKFGIEPNRPMVLFLSRIHPKKGLDLLIPAFAKVARDKVEGKEPLLALVGPDMDGYRAEVEALINTHGLNENIIWTGMLTGAEKVQAYVDSDLFVLPSYQENFGISVAEAMAAGVSVIISDKVNLDRDVLAAQGGAVVPTRVEPLAEAIGKWLGNDELRQRAGSAGRKFAFKHFSWDSIASRWIEHYASLIETYRCRLDAASRA